MVSTLYLFFLESKHLVNDTLAPTWIESTSSGWIKDLCTNTSPPPSSGTTKPKPLAHIQRSIAPHWRSPGDPSWGLGASGPVLVLRRPGCGLWLGII